MAAKETPPKRDGWQNMGPVKLFFVAKKELDLIRSQKINLLLAFFMAALVMGSLVLSFGNISGLGGVQVGVAANEGAGITAQDLIGQINEIDQSGQIQLVSFANLDDMRLGIARKEVIVGILIEEKRPNGQLVVKVLYDNTNVLTAGLFRQLASSRLDAISAISTREVISQVWDQFAGIDETVSGQDQQIDDFILKLEESKSDLDKLREDMKKFDPATAKSALIEKRQSIASIETKIDGFEKDLEETANLLNENEDDARQARDWAKQALAVSPSDPNLQQVAAKTETIYQQIIDMQAKVEQAKDDIGFFKEELASGKNDLVELDDSIDAFSTSLQDANHVLTTAEASRIEVGQKLRDSKVALGELGDLLKQLAAIDKDFVLQPVIQNPREGMGLYEATYLERIIPIGLALVLFLICVLLTSISFVLEKAEGTHSRLLLSKTSPLIVYGGKMLGQLGFGVVLGHLTLLIGVLLLPLVTKGAPLHITFSVELFAAITLICFAFISIGLLIAHFSKNQNTAILGSLLIILPLFFLSGAIIPLDLVSPLIQGFARFLPLTIGVTILQEILIKQTALLDLWPEMVRLLVPSILMMGFVVWKRKVE